MPVPAVGQRSRENDVSEQEDSSQGLPWHDAIQTLRAVDAQGHSAELDVDLLQRISASDLHLLSAVEQWLSDVLRG